MISNNATLSNINAPSKTSSNKQYTLEMIASKKDDKTQEDTRGFVQSPGLFQHSVEKLNNQKCREILQKYYKRKIPDESTLRKSYLNPLYLEVLERNRVDIGDPTFDYLLMKLSTHVEVQMNQSSTHHKPAELCPFITQYHPGCINRLLREGLSTLTKDLLQSAPKDKALIKAILPKY